MRFDGESRLGLPTRKYRALLAIIAALILASALPTCGAYTGTVSTVSADASVQSSGLEILGNGGGSGAFTYKGGGNAVDAAVAAALVACVVNPGNASLGGYGGHMLIWKSGWDGEPKLVTCIDFNSAAGSLASSNMFVNNIDPITGTWTNGSAANQYGWKAVAVPGTLAGLYMAQTNYGKKVSGTNYLSFAEILKPTLARFVTGEAIATSYYTLAAVSNLVMELYTNSPGYTDTNGQPNPNSANNPCTPFYAGDIALDIVAAMQANGGLVTYADLTNYRPREVTPYSRHFNPPNGTPATVYVAPPGSSGVSVLQQLAMLEALGWTNGPTGTWDSLHYWHSRAEAARLMWKEHFQWIGDPWAGVLPPNFLGNGSTNFADQLLARATNGYPFSPAWDTTEIRLTNSLANSITQAVNNETNVPILVHWNDIRYGTRNISVSDKWGNCVVVTFSMGGGYGAQVGVPSRGLVFGQGMALFELRPGWPNSIAPRKRQLNNMSPAIVVPDYPVSPTNGSAGGRPPLAIGAVGGSTIENNIAMELAKYLTDGPSSGFADPSSWLLNFEGNTTIYMRPSYPSGVQSFLQTVGLSAPGGPPSSGEVSHTEAWIPPVILTQPASTNISSGATVTFEVTATGLPLFYQWYRYGTPLTNSGSISGAQAFRLTVNAITNSGAYYVVLTSGGETVTSAPAGVSIGGAPAILTQPPNLTNFPGSQATFSVTAMGTAPLSYQWLKNGANLADGGNISGANSNVLNVSSLTLGDAGAYAVIVSNSAGTQRSLNAFLAVVSFTTYPSQYSLEPIWWAIPGNGSYPYVTSTGGANTPYERSIAYNALSNQLIVVHCPVSSTAYAVYVVDASTGTNLYTLRTTGVVHEGASEVSGSNPIDLVAAAVADDGALYICNQSPNSSGGAAGDTNKMFRVYRWANTGSNSAPASVFQGDPSGRPAGTNERWGDVMAVRGSGTNTELFLNSYDGLYAAVLKPTDSSLTRFTNYWFSDSAGNGSIGRSVQFGSNNSGLEKRKGTNLFYSTYNTNAHNSGIFSSIVFSNTLGGVFTDTGRNLAVGVDFVGSASQPDAVALYDITDSSVPILLGHYSFPINQVANANFICQTVVSGWKAFSLDANNGLVAFYINPPANLMVLNIAPSGNHVNLSWAQSAAVLQSSPTLNPSSWTDLTFPGQTNSLPPSSGTPRFYRLMLRR
jgi:gamma-glutamyltranspeptidase/glutathione hydrolase